MESPILKYFEYKHLPDKLQRVSEHFYNLAHSMEKGIPSCAEKSAGLRKILEAKDCFVRASMEKEDIHHDFGLKMNESRRKKNLTLRMLGKLVNLPPSYLSEIEGGFKVPLDDEYRIIKKTLDME